MNYKNYIKKKADIDFMINRLKEISDDKIKNNFINGIKISKANLVKDILYDLKQNRNIDLRLGEPVDFTKTNNNRYILKDVYIRKDDKIVLVVKSNDSGFSYNVSDKTTNIILD